MPQFGSSLTCERRQEYSLQTNSNDDHPCAGSGGSASSCTWKPSMPGGRPRRSSRGPASRSRRCRTCSRPCSKRSHDPSQDRGTGIRNDPPKSSKLSPHFEGPDRDGEEDLIPPDASPLARKVGGDHYSGPDGEAGNDRWTMGRQTRAAMLARYPLLPRWCDWLDNRSAKGQSTLKSAIAVNAEPPQPPPQEFGFAEITSPFAELSTEQRSRTCTSDGSRRGRAVRRELCRRAGGPHRL